MKAVTIARRNFIKSIREKSRSPWAPEIPAFINLNPDKGMGFVLLYIKDHPDCHRSDILENLGKDKNTPGYYCDTFQRLSWSKLIKFRKLGYVITELGKKLITELNLI